MKILKSFLLLALFTFMLGCSSDDDSPTALTLTNETFAGDYTLTFLQSTEVETQTINGGTIITTIESVGDTFTNAVYTFNTNGTFTGSGSFRINETITVTGNPPVEDSYIVNEDFAGNYTLNSTNRTVSIDGDTYSIVRFTDSELILTLSETETIDGVESVYNEEIRFTR